MEVLELEPEDIRTAARDYLVSGQWFVSIAGGMGMEDLISE
jgi:hypothetical protein